MAEPEQTPEPGPQAVDGRVEALKAFKDWSNYLLVTTVAAIGWIAKSAPASATAQAPSFVLSLAIWCLGISAVFGIFTLALVPLVSEQMKDAEDSSSIFTVPVKFFVVMTEPWTMYLSQSCRPQHLSFILGILLYCVDATWYRVPPLTWKASEWPRVSEWGPIAAPIVLVFAFVIVAIRSHRRN